MNKRLKMCSTNTPLSFSPFSKSFFLKRILKQYLTISYLLSLFKVASSSVSLSLCEVLQLSSDFPHTLLAHSTDPFCFRECFYPIHAHTIFPKFSTHKHNTSTLTHARNFDRRIHPYRSRTIPSPFVLASTLKSRNLKA